MTINKNNKILNKNEMFWTTQFCKKFIFIISLTFLSVNIQAIVESGNENYSTKSSRNITNINSDWKFQLGDHFGAEKVSYKDGDWQNIGLPHSFSLPYFLSSDFYTGYGWYRKNIILGKKIENSRFSLEFEGVFQVAEVYVNSIHVGTHRGGYNGFSIDISKAIHAGNNVIAVRVNNIWDAQLAPRAGEHVFSGGIYRDVRLVETNPVHVVWYGTFVTTPELSEKSGKVNIKTEISNDGLQQKDGILTTNIIDAQGKQLLKIESPFSLKNGQTKTFDQTSSPISEPQLWSPSNPVLYKAITTLEVNNKVVDRYETSFGMRWIKWTADKGFFLNGKHYYFKGVNVHQDHAGWGDAVTNAGFGRDVKMMKDAGFDFIRGSHYPHDPAFSDACDKQGMFFWSENCFWGIGGFKPEGDWSSSAYPSQEKDEKEFENSVKESLKEMIRIHRNHPSIIVWSMCNEPFFSVPEQMSKVRIFLKDLVALSHKLDSTRPAAIGGCQRGGIDTLGDVAGYNGDGAKLYINPGVANVVSEYGSTISDRPGKYIPNWGDLQQEQFDWRSGQAIWCGFDHASIAGHFGCMGIVDYFRLPKQQWYWYRYAYLGIKPDKQPENGVPAGIKLMADKKTISNANGTDDVHLIVKVLDKDGNIISNVPDVKFEIVSGPGEFPTGSTILFQNNSDIVIRDGEAAIEFRSYYAGKTIIRATSPGLESKYITIISKGAPKYKWIKPQSISRPYVRYVTQRKMENESTIDLLAQRPTKVSSSLRDHSSRLANDLDQSTWWQADEVVAKESWWQVDMENIYSLSQIRITFSQKMKAMYCIQVSLDGSVWTTIVDQLSNTSIDMIRTDTTLAKNKGRFLRVVFQPGLAIIADIKAFGSSDNQIN